MDFAIIETGGKQYKVVPEKPLEIEKIDGKAGDTIGFDKVLLIADGENVEIGTPYLEGKTIDLEIVEQKRGKKIRILRFKAKSRHRRRQGHRQSLSKVALSSNKKTTPAPKKTSQKPKAKSVK